VREGLAEHVPNVYRFALRLTGDRHRAEDLTQETFLRAWQRQEQLKEGRAVRFWLFRIAANLWTDELRRGHLPTASIPHRDFEVVCERATPNRTAEAKEEMQRALRLLDGLPVRQRSVLYLTAIEELSLSEVADVIGIDKNTAKVHLSLARKKMRQLAKTTAVLESPRAHGNSITDADV
jgi:RNA polymerase sigma-70 factor (ECF subfamily)